MGFIDPAAATCILLFFCPCRFETGSTCEVGALAFTSLRSPVNQVTLLPLLPGKHHAYGLHSLKEKFNTARLTCKTFIGLLYLYACSMVFEALHRHRHVCFLSLWTQGFA